MTAGDDKAVLGGLAAAGLMVLAWLLKYGVPVGKLIWRWASGPYRVAAMEQFQAAIQLDQAEIKETIKEHAQVARATAITIAEELQEFQRETRAEYREIRMENKEISAKLNRLLGKMEEDDN